MISFEILLVSLLSSLIFFVVMHVWKFRRFYYLGFQLPGPSLFLSVGYAFSFIGTNEIITKNFIKFYKTESSNKPMIRMWYGTKLFVITSNPDLIHKVLKDNLQKMDFMYDRLNMMFLNGKKSIFTEDIIPKWKAHRKIISHNSFNACALKSYIDIFVQETNILTNKMRTFANSGKVFEPMDLLTLASFSMIVRTMSGLDMKIQQNFQFHHPCTTAAEAVFTNMAERLMKPYLLIDTLYTLLGYKKCDTESRILGETFVDELISQVKSKLSQDEVTQLKSKQGDDIVLPIETDQANFIEVVLQRQMDPNTPPELVMSDIELRNEIITVFIGGFDTTRAANTIILLMLAIHPTIQEKVYDEIQTIVGENPDIPMTYNQLQQLHVLTRVIKESLRLFPSGPIMGRYAERDIQYEGYTIPEGTSLVVFITGLHRDPNYWPNPDQFDPDRFLPSEAAKQHPNSYIPFSDGTRNCLGYKYAMLQMKTTISGILRQYRVLPGDKCKSIEDIRFEFGVTLKLLSGNDIRLEPRCKPT